MEFSIKSGLFFVETTEKGKVLFVVPRLCSLFACVKRVVGFAVLEEAELLSDVFLSDDAFFSPNVKDKLLVRVVFASIAGLMKRGAHNIGDNSLLQVRIAGRETRAALSEFTIVVADEEKHEILVSVSGATSLDVSEISDLEHSIGCIIGEMVIKITCCLENIEEAIIEAGNF